MKRVRILVLCFLGVLVLSLSALNEQLSLQRLWAEADTVSTVAGVPGKSTGFLPQIILDLNNTGAKSQAEYAEKIAEWRAVNEDVVGYIDIPGFDISYPVLQGETNKTYLRTNIYKEKDNAGCIFLDSNYPDIYSPVKLIHGHHMSNGTMFGKLPDMLFYETLDDAPTIYYTDDLGTKQFEIFSVFSVNSEEESVIVSQYSMIDDMERYKQEYVERSWPASPGVPEGTELLMLNTCWYGFSGKEHNLHCIVVAARVA